MCAQVDEDTYLHMLASTFTELGTEKRCLNFFRLPQTSGDHDPGISFVGTQAWIRSLNFSIVDDWRRWLVNDQVAGSAPKPMFVFSFLLHEISPYLNTPCFHLTRFRYTRTYSNNLTFATVKVRSLLPIFALYKYRLCMMEVSITIHCLLSVRPLLFSGRRSRSCRGQAQRMSGHVRTMDFKAAFVRKKLHSIFSFHFYKFYLFSLYISTNLVDCFVHNPWGRAQLQWPASYLFCLGFISRLPYSNVSVI